MSWESEKYYPGGKVIYIPEPHCEWYMIIYRHPEHGDFFRGYISKYQMVEQGII